MQIELLAGVPSQLPRKQAVYAIRGPNASTELAMLATLQALSPAALPCLPALLSQRDSSSKTLGELYIPLTLSSFAYPLQMVHFLNAVNFCILVIVS